MQTFHHIASRAKLLGTACVFLLLGHASAQRTRHSLTLDSCRIEYEREQGRIHGKYQSFYPNGQLKTSGEFAHNSRLGEWEAYSAAGELVVERSYKSPYEYQLKTARWKNDPLVELLSQPLAKPKRNEAGYLEHPEIGERQVDLLFRIHRGIDPAENPLLFDRNFWLTVHQSIQDSLITAYDPTLDDFWQKALSGPEIDPLSINLIQLKIKEEWFYDLDRQQSEYRILGICPVAQVGTDTLSLYWIYYPELRPLLSKHAVKSKDLPKYVRTLDDLLFYRCFSGIMCRDGWDRNLCRGKLHRPHVFSETESEQDELQIIEMEHNRWLGNVAY